MTPSLQLHRDLEAACGRLFAAGPFPLVFALADVDNFRQFNATVSDLDREAMLDRLRAEITARVGLAFVARVADEFLIIAAMLPDAVLRDAVAAAGRFTVSVGIVTVDSPAPVERVWRAAAVLCSESKLAGGNATTVRDLSAIADDARVHPAPTQPIFLPVRTAGPGCGHDEPKDGCPGCKLWATNAAYRQAQIDRAPVAYPPEKPWRFWVQAPASLWHARGLGDGKAAVGIIIEGITGKPPPAPGPRERLCIHLGEPLDAAQPDTPYRPDASGELCNCPGKWRRACDVHGECRVSDSGGPQKCCQTLDSKHPSYCGRYDADGD